MDTTDTDNVGRKFKNIRQPNGHSFKMVGSLMVGSLMVTASKLLRYCKDYLRMKTSF